jgi:hypothetical protein
MTEESNQAIETRVGDEFDDDFCSGKYLEPWRHEFRRGFKYFTSEIIDDSGTTVTRFEKPFSISQVESVFEEKTDDKLELRTYKLHFTCLKKYYIKRTPKGFTLIFKSDNPLWLEEELAESGGLSFTTEGMADGPADSL